jgi:hypothetical protein
VDYIDSGMYKPFEHNPDGVCIEFIDKYTFDFSKPCPLNNHVALYVKVSLLGLSAPERHAFLLLVGSRYDPYTDSVKLHDPVNEQDSLGADYDRYTTLAKYHLQLQELVSAAKVFNINLELWPKVYTSKVGLVACNSQAEL